MRKSRIALVVTAGLCLLTTACASPAIGGTSASGGSGTLTGAGVARCAVGSWTSTGLAGSLASNGVSGSISGGDGYTIRIAADGTTVVDFGRMHPVRFATTLVGTTIKGWFSYGGKVHGIMRMPATDARSGQWQPSGSADFSGLTVTAELTSPQQTRLATRMPMSQFTGGPTGGTVDTTPILRNGTYECGSNTLTIGPPANTPLGGSWTLRRT